jgi:DNA modification methylase|tara:strand:- start:139 stop:831 length:693 start_codon:yes stop_codon:yes gene_type:complete
MKLINADCLQALKEFEDNSVDYVFTSPPYNIGRSNNKTKSDMKAKYEFFEDNNPNYFDWCVEIINELLRVSKKYVIWNIQPNYSNKKEVFRIMGHFADKLQQNIIWYKPDGTPSSIQHRVSNFVEYILFFTNNIYVEANKHFIKNLVSINKISKNEKLKNHSAVMPQELSNYIIENFTQENEIILDPFMGMGTTGVSCVKLNRNFIGIELVKEYYDYATERINNTQIGLF